MTIDIAGLIPENGQFIIQIFLKPTQLPEGQLCHIEVKSDGELVIEQKLDKNNQWIKPSLRILHFAFLYYFLKKFSSVWGKPKKPENK